MFGFVVDASQAYSRLDRMASVIADGSQFNQSREGLQQAGDTYLQYVRRNFMSNSLGSGGWKDLAMSTKLARYRKFFGSTRKVPRQTIAATPFPILYITGKFYGSFIRGATGSFEQITADGVKEGTNIFHARFHQRGSSRLPQRKTIESPDAATVSTMASQVQGGFMTAIRNA